MTEKIVLYGLGTYGFWAFFLLMRYGIKVDYFVDRDETKHGYVTNDVDCIGFEDMMTLDRNLYTIIVCNKYPDSIIKEILEAGFQNVLSFFSIDNLIKDKDVIVENSFSDENDVLILKRAIENIYMNRTNAGCYGIGELLLSDIAQRFEKK